MDLNDIIIDENIENVIPKISDTDFDQLENNLIKDGVAYDPLIVWKGKDILVDGHNRYKVLKKHPDIKYSIKEINFMNMNDVISWVCYNQLGRRNLTRQQRNYLLATVYNIAKRPMGGDQHSEKAKARQFKNLNVGANNTAELIGNMFNISPKTVSRSAQIIKAIEEADKLFPGTKSKYINGFISLPDKMIVKVLTVPKSEKYETAQAVSRNDKEFFLNKDRPARQTTEKTVTYEDTEHRTIQKPDLSEADTSTKGLVSSLEGVNDNMEQSLKIIFQSFSDALDKKEGKEIAESIISEGMDVLYRYQDKLRKE